MPAASDLLNRFNQLDAVCENATVALFAMDDRQHCVYMNRAAELLTGFTLADVQGRPLHESVHHTHPDGSPFPIEDCPIDRAAPQNMREQGEAMFVHRDGHFYPVAFTASPVRRDGAVIGTVIEVRSIEDERRHEAEQQAMRELAE
ncbi:MAG TPA: PAS domain-containing protein, partial [Lysobacter sp.]